MSTRQEWKSRYLKKASEIHKRNLDKFANRMLKRVDSWKNSLVSRSKKYNVDCSVTLEELRELMLNAYGTNCKYCGRRLDINNIVIDHIIPISSKGDSNVTNLQVICKTSNHMKGSLDEKSFIMLLEWLKTVPEHLAKDISIRLSRGIH